MEYIDTLVEINAVSSISESVKDIGDLSKKGVDFTVANPILVVDIPKEGAVVRDVKVPSSNVGEIKVTLTTVDGVTLPPIQGEAMNLPRSGFTTDKVSQIVVQILTTTDGDTPKAVRLSVVACAPGITPATSEGEQLM
jgi:hypothetical protein